MKLRLDWRLATLLGMSIAAAAYFASRPHVAGPQTAEEASVRPSSPAQSQSASVQNAPEVAKSPVAIEPARGSAGSSRKVWSDFAAATDYRRFALEAAQHPESGGITYARQAISICRALGNLLPLYGIEATDTIPYNGTEDPKAHAAKAKSLETMRRNCANFSSAELSGPEEIRYGDLAKSKGDVLFGVQDRFAQSLKSANPEAKAGAIGEILSLKDPLLLSNTLQRMMVDRNSSGQLGYWLDGVFTPTVEGGAMEAAIKAMPCRYGLACDISDIDVMRTCLSGNGCFESKQALLKASLSPEDQAKFEALQQRLAQVIDTADTTAVTRRK